MCAIFGLLDFQDKFTPAQRRVLFRELANAAQMRGTDASGVAYVQNGTIQIRKAPGPPAKCAGGSPRRPGISWATPG